ncbi:uncharacterized protein BJ212DRAFT_813835 [Suillus subaureus]|uniref:Uncharacterized protein n=1 Tax=Suillus subaureus TaxID=48587 RepID=A0A9P7JH83_9AGAM|nr:uncharacterized protein BJ212DRAFT_813835 [Suillus subaureus]KAG1822567.1 hypothetical protein BJ212DRAFT_813835 [Suillus subaureus]
MLISALSSDGTVGRRLKRVQVAPLRRSKSFFDCTLPAACRPGHTVADYCQMTNSSRHRLPTMVLAEITAGCIRCKL